MSVWTLDYRCGCFVASKPHDAGVKYKHRFEPPKPPTSHYSYSNPHSQGALICETRNFPSGYNDDVDVHSAYSDRMYVWDAGRFEKACEIAGGGDQAWSYRLPNLTQAKLIEFARVALNLDKDPIHVRVVHYYNVSSGYSCPVVIAITRKDETDEPERKDDRATPKRNRRKVVDA